jgi:SAM-dependent methyltransferase
MDLIDVSSSFQNTDMLKLSESRNTAPVFDQERPASADSYDRSRDSLILSHVDNGLFRQAFEPGCSTGVLTVELAHRCAHVYATDVSADAITQAQFRCRALSNVQLSVDRLTAAITPESYDLVVFSEIGYTFTLTELDAVAEALAHALVDGGRFIAAHWLGSSPDQILHGAEIHDRLMKILPFKQDAQVVVPHPEHTGFVLDVWNRVDHPLPQLDFGPRSRNLVDE